MKALSIIVEGKTEMKFVKDHLTPYFAQYHQIYDVRPITLETSVGHKGGDLRYKRYKSNLKKLLAGSGDFIVSSLIDFYKLHEDFPEYEQAKKIPDVEERVSYLEQACINDIADHRFIPYIQLHEFEALVFTNAKGFADITMSEHSRNKIEKIIQKYDNPELINDGATTAPSKRLKRLIPIYQKPFHGNLIIQNNGGIKTIKEKCPRFNVWIDTLVTRLKT
ncbi:MAG: DUF4276 family protein [Flammeovirgaceae bacterium]